MKLPKTTVCEDPKTAEAVAVKGRSCREARRARGDALWQMLDERRGAEALLLCPPSPAGFRGGSLVTI